MTLFRTLHPALTFTLSSDSSNLDSEKDYKVNFLAKLILVMLIGHFVSILFFFGLFFITNGEAWTCVNLTANVIGSAITFYSYWLIWTKDRFHFSCWFLILNCTALGILNYLEFGTTLPFGMTFLVPISLAIVLLKLRHVILVAGFCTVFSVGLELCENIFCIYSPLVHPTPVITTLINAAIFIVVIPMVVTLIILPTGSLFRAVEITNRQLERDLRNLRRSEKSLRQSEEKSQALLHAIPDTLLRVSREGFFLDCKPATDELAPIFSQLAGKNIGEIWPVDLALAHMNKVLQVGQLQVFEYQLIHEEHMYDFEVRLVSNGADEMLALQRNITEQKKIERRKNEFISVVSHELRTPLTSIHGSLGVLVGGVAGEVSAPVKTMLELAYRNSQRLIRLINDILDIEKLTFSGLELKLQPLELLAVLQEAVTDCQPYARQFGVRFILEEQKELLPKLIVQADRERLIQVLDNLLSNAAKFSPPAGMVEVSAFLAQQGKLVRVTVSDHGSGIPLEFQKHIFEKFTQADASDKRYKGGTGLGLSIAKALVEKHGGQIGFETAKGQGTTFYFDLPLLSPLLLD